MVVKKLFCNLMIAASWSNMILADPITAIPPRELSWKTYETVASHASQSPDELLYLKVDWKNTVLEAQREAFEKDKPIVMILFFGDHRSNC
jgi:hypothetical protein